MEKRFCILLCAEESEYVKNKYGGYFQVFVGLLGEEGETWDVYGAAKGELPCDEDIDSYDGFVISGSCNDAHGNEPWILALVHLLKKLDSMRKKILGICFGHQILCRALGGKTGRAREGWDIGVTTVHLSHTSSKFLSPDLAAFPCCLRLIECHRDEVWEVPPLAEVIGRSARTGVEMFRYGDHAMGIQGHPEYDRDILLHLIDRLLQRQLIQSYHAELAKLNFINGRDPDREAWKRLCRTFLKGGVTLS